jgi:hypothetical protein
MPIFYRGAGVGTHWHTNDPRGSGFIPQSPGTVGSISQMMNHIARGSTNSPFVSLTRSYGVAQDYARLGGRIKPTASNPAYVWEVEITDPLPPGIQLFDPVKDVAATISSPLSSPSYHHDGSQQFLLGVVHPKGKMRRFLKQPYPQPPPGGGTPRSPNLTIELETLVRALRDAEILVLGTVPASCIRSLNPVS